MPCEAASRRFCLEIDSGPEGDSFLQLPVCQATEARASSSRSPASFNELADAADRVS